MYKRILVPIDLADPDLAKPAVATALMMTGPSDGMIRFVNVLPLTPVMLAEYVPPDFEVQQRKASEDALAIVVKETGLGPERVSSTVRQGGIYQEILEEASAIKADLKALWPCRLVVKTEDRRRNALQLHSDGVFTIGRESIRECSTAAGAERKTLDPLPLRYGEVDMVSVDIGIDARRGPQGRCGYPVGDRKISFQQQRRQT